MSKRSHSGKSKPGRPKPIGTLGELNDTSESRVLVMVERHFSMNWQGRTSWSRPNERLIARRFGQPARETPPQSASWIYMSDVRPEIEMSSLTGCVYEDAEFLQRSSTRLHKRPIIPPGTIAAILDRDFAEPWFEEGNVFINLFLSLKRRDAKCKLPTWVGWHNCDKPGTKIIGEADGENGKIVKAREMADENREVRWMDSDTIQYQARHISARGAKRTKCRGYAEGGHLPFPNFQYPKPGKGLEMGSGIVEVWWLEPRC